MLGPFLTSLQGPYTVSIMGPAGPAVLTVAHIPDLRFSTLSGCKAHLEQRWPEPGQALFPKVHTRSYCQGRPKRPHKHEDPTSVLYRPRHWGFPTLLGSFCLCVFVGPLVRSVQTHVPRCT